jgi:hypothetical protein
MAVLQPVQAGVQTVAGDKLVMGSFFHKAAG